jgi:ubiquitin-protein ligase
MISKNKENIGDTCLIPYINQYIYGLSVIEISKNIDYYTNLIKIFYEIYKLEKYNDKFNLEKISSQKNNLKEFPTIYECISDIKFESIENNNDSEYVTKMKDLAFDTSEIVFNKRFKFPITPRDTSTEFSRRVQRELVILNDNLIENINENSSIFLRYDESNISVMKFLIIPQPDTPYAYGCFEFDMQLKSFPMMPPHVEIITTGGGTFRFNPNLYDNGKVCLSLLGTWGGKEGESWNPSQSTILQILLSIQSIIFCEEPYFNEPGYESSRGTEKGKLSNDKYNQPVRYNTMLLAMINQLKNPSFGFEEVIKTHFKLMKNKIYHKLDSWCELSDNKILFSQKYDELKTLINNLE